jgi:hypothetical protein
MDQPMKMHFFPLAGLMAMILVVPPVEAESATSAKVAEKDFGRLSADGMSAFEDIHLARMAIFDGHTDEAAKLVADAKTSLAKAKADGAAFSKAESALRMPADGPAGRGNDATPIMWIPIDSRIDAGETFQPTAERAAAVITAKKHLMKGEGAKALQVVTVAALDMDYTLALAPLDKSVADIDDAAKLIAARDFYGASQAIRHAEAGIRFDEIDDIANVRGGSVPGNAK